MDEVATAYPAVASVITEKQTQFGEEQFYDLFAQLALQTIDSLWVDHLDLMGHIRSSVSLRAYGQRDPLIEYRKEGTYAFQDLLTTITRRIAEVLPNVEPRAIAKEEEQHQKQAEAAIKASEQTAPETGASPRTAAATPGRNDIVTITNGTETETLKYKKAEAKLAAGWRMTTNSQ
jgi:preprotein translocase subunit SecA